jgi:hypothetical protein
MGVSRTFQDLMGLISLHGSSDIKAEIITKANIRNRLLTRKGKKLLMLFAWPLWRD